MSIFRKIKAVWVALAATSMIVLSATSNVYSQDDTPKNSGSIQPIKGTITDIKKVDNIYTITVSSSEDGTAVAVDMPVDMKVIKLMDVSEMKTGDNIKFTAVAGNGNARALTAVTGSQSALEIQTPFLPQGPIITPESPKAPDMTPRDRNDK